MLEPVISFIAPHSCSSCGELGTILCERCKNNILKRRYEGCILCGRTTTASHLCRRHRLPYDDAWCVAKRGRALEVLIDRYKFQRCRAAHSVLAELLDAALPPLPPETVIVPVPTAPRNCRIRGYDHMWLIARALGRRRGLKTACILGRQSNLTQHFAPSAAERRRRAKRYFTLKAPVPTDAPLLLIDDIFTTGATIQAAANCLRQAGAQEVRVAVIARQGYA